uniref:Uncharacterized protein n=1 Tax=Nelumbo nucifera TaxID=4432 RepID=A0A822XPD1_NELNU|nr:TPA_asm: hypothetical protein HUJ06_023365 [Nelumbo nucifera]
MIDSPTKIAVLLAIALAAVEDEKQRMLINIILAREMDKEWMSISKTPYHDDILTGLEYLKNVIYSGSSRCLDMFKLIPTVFLRLVALMR